MRDGEKSNPLFYPANLIKQTIYIVQLPSHVQLFAAPWTSARQASLSFTISRSLLKLLSIDSVMESNHHVLCHPLLLLPSIFPSIRVFSNELTLPIRWPKYWSFSFSISPSNEYSGMISFRIDWFDLQYLFLWVIMKVKWQYAYETIITGFIFRVQHVGKYLYLFAPFS